MDYNLENIPDELESINAARDIQSLYLYGISTQTDAFTSCTCKRRMFLLKCLIEDLYKELPDFPQQEKEWEQERIIQLLRKK